MVHMSKISKPSSCVLWHRGPPGVVAYACWSAPYQGFCYVCYVCLFCGTFLPKFLKSIKITWTCLGCTAGLAFVDESLLWNGEGEKPRDLRAKSASCSHQGRPKNLWPSYEQRDPQGECNFRFCIKLYIII